MNRYLPARVDALEHELKKERTRSLMEEINSQKSPTPEQERNEVLEQFRDWTDVPMFLLGFIWLVLLVVELVWGLTPSLEILTTLVWVLFIVQFTLELALAPRKARYIRDNWLTVISLIVPALRVFRITRVVKLLRLTRTARGLRLVRVVGSLNRSINGIRKNLSMYGAGYVAIMSITVALVGAAGMYAFELNLPEGQGLESYGDALWWTAMIMTTLGSQYWPRTVEGRILGFILSLYAFGVFGYVTGALASFFVGREKAAQQDADKESLTELSRELRKLQDDLKRIADKPPKGDEVPGDKDQERSRADSHS